MHKRTSGSSTSNSKTTSLSVSKRASWASTGIAVQARILIKGETNYQEEGEHTGGWKNVQPLRGQAYPCLQGLALAAPAARGPAGAAIPPLPPNFWGAGWLNEQSGRVHAAPNLQGTEGWMKRQASPYGQAGKRLQKVSYVVSY